MVDWFVILAPVFLLAVVALLRFIGCGELLSIGPDPLSISSLNPDNTRVRKSLTLVIEGSSFETNPLVNFGKSVLTPITSVTENKINVQVPGNLPELANAGKVDVTVENSNNVRSAPRTFTVNNPRPQITEFSPPFIAQGGCKSDPLPTFELTVKGSDFLSGLRVDFGSSMGIAPNSVTPEEIKASIPKAAIANAGKVKVTVTNPDPSEGPAESELLNIRAPIPVVFTSPPLQGNLGANNPLDGDYPPSPNGILNFGTGLWAWSGPSGPAPGINIFFAGPGTARNFAFVGPPRILVSMRVFTPPNTPTQNITLTSNTGESKVQSITAGTLQTVETCWLKLAQTITVDFPGGADLAIDMINYIAPP